MVNLSSDKITNFINFLINSNDHKKYIECIKETYPKKAEYVECNLNLPKQLNDYLLQKGIKLYTHQYDVLKNVREGNNVLITTSTASGKTLSFNIPIFEELINNHEATALYIYPTKALTNDQLESLKNLEKEIGIDVKPAVYDGDTPQNKRAVIRNKSRIILMNPYELHHVLQYNPKWMKFFKNLKFVVIDEAHTYRGVFGSNIAFLIRRLRRVCESYGSNPQFILASATLANPKEFSEKLVGVEFKYVYQDGSPKNQKFFVFYNTLRTEYSDTSWYKGAVNILKIHIKRDLQTLAFTKSRKIAELIALWTKGKFEKLGSPLANKISSYRSGYSPKERRRIENTFKNKKLKAVVSTNALEVGIDIGSLDAVIMYGYPGTLMSFWQQAGRAGRSNSSSVVTFFPGEFPLDQYIATHPEIVFKDTTENIVLSTENPQVIVGNILCAAAEIPITSEDKKFFSENMDELLEFLSDNGLLKNTPRGWIYAGTVRASELVSLDAAFSQEFKILGEKGNIIEIIDEAHAYAEAHKGAVFLHNGETYIIKDMDIESKTCTAVRRSVGYYTRAKAITHIEVVEELAKKDFNEFSIHLGEVIVNKTYYAYDVMEFGRKRGEYSLDLPPLELNTIALWFSFKNEFFNEPELSGRGDIGDGLHASEHAMINIFPLHVMCDSNDIGGLATNMHLDTKSPSIFIYDAVEGGIGLSEKAFEIPEKIIKTAYELVNDCKCGNGCPACIYSSNCGCGNLHLDKLYATKILKKMLEILDKSL